MSSLSDRKGVLGLGCAIALLVLMAATSASAETLLMPKRDYLMGASEVVWGVSTLPSAVASTWDLDFGDGSAHATGNLSVTDRSYIAVNHTYLNSGPMTVTLTVINGATTETTSVVVNVYNGAMLTPEASAASISTARLKTGCVCWTQISARAANFPTSNSAFWTNQSYTSLVVLAFENHGYKLSNNDNAPTGLYEKYVVQRGLNQVISGLTNLTLNVQTNLGSPCVGAGIEPAPWHRFAGQLRQRRLYNGDRVAAVVGEAVRWRGTRVRSCLQHRGKNVCGDSAACPQRGGIEPD